METNRFKKPDKQKIGRAIDGFMPSTGSSASRGSVNNFRRGSSYRPNSMAPQVSIDDFRRPEGFHPVVQTELASEKAKVPEVVPEPQLDYGRPPKTPRKWSIFKRKKNRGPKKPPRIKQKWLRLSLKSLGVVLAGIVLIAAFLLVKGYLKGRGIFKGGSNGAAALNENPDPAKLRGEGDGRVNILILGKGGEGHEAPDLTDTIIIASVDPIAKEAALLSIPRDLYVKIPGNGNMKINAAYATAKYAVLDRGKITPQLTAEAEKAGFESIQKTIEQTIGIPIHYQVMLDFQGFEQAVNTVGGIDINVPKAVSETMRIKGKQYNLNVKTGWQHFDGFRALAYARSRHTSPRGDFDRAERQRLIILALKDKVLSLGTLANPVKINQLIDAFGDHVETNLSIDELLRLYDIGKDISADKITSLSLADPPNVLVRTGLVDGQSVVYPQAGIGNYKAIQAFVRNTLKDGFIRNENASIAIYNGTGTVGFAATKAEELRSFGYNVTTVDNAPTKNYVKTVIVDNTNGTKKYTKRYLEQRFGVLTTGQLPDGNIKPPVGTDFVIILGSETATP